LDRREAGPPLPRVSVEIRERQGEKIAHTRIDHPDPPTGNAVLASAIALCDESFFAGQLKSLASAANRLGTLDEGLLNYGSSIVAGIQPKDHVEALLATQMAAIHIATMDMAARVGNANSFEGRVAFEKSFTRLVRTFAGQVEALKRYRSTGEQRVIVERVNVHAGGQAIVGNVSHASGTAGGGDVDENQQ